MWLIAVYSVACLEWRGRRSLLLLKPSLQKRLEGGEAPVRKSPRLFSLKRSSSGIKV